MVAPLTMDTIVRRSVLDVAVLGRVEVRLDGRRLRTGRKKSVELLVYLAMHPWGADTDQLWDALWPDRPMSPAVLHTSVSVARRTLREHAAQPPQVTDARDGRLYQLDGPRRVDWHHFEQLVEDGRRADHPRDEILALAAALDLVRGTPFLPTAASAYDWARPHRTAIEAAIAEAAERLGLLRLEHGDVLGARHAARQGLRAAPYDERLYRVLMRAARGASSTGVEAVMRELTEVLGVAPGETEPETQALYHALRGRSGGWAGRSPTR